MDSSYLIESLQQKNYKLVAALSTFFKLKIELQRNQVTDQDHTINKWLRVCFLQSLCSYLYTLLLV